MHKATSAGLWLLIGCALVVVSEQYNMGWSAGHAPSEVKQPELPQVTPASDIVTPPTSATVNLVSRPICNEDCECAVCRCKPGKNCTLAACPKKAPAKPVAAQSGCANGRCQLPAAPPKRTTVAAPQRTGTCAGGNCGVRSRGRLFGRWR